MNGANLACSGAQTSTGGTGSGEDFKPGIDFYTDAQGRQGQALALQQLRGDAQRQGRRRADRRQQLRLRRHRPDAASTDWLTSPSWWKNYCNDDSDMTSRFTAARQRDRDDERQERAAERRARR